MLQDRASGALRLAPGLAQSGPLDAELQLSLPRRYLLVDRFKRFHVKMPAGL